MSERTLQDCRIAIVEDEFFLADDLRTDLTNAGAIIVGMASTVENAIALIEAQAQLDGAVLDVNLGGETVFPVADRLQARGVPFLFATGYDRSAIPSRFDGIARCEKPFDLATMVRAIGRMVSG